MISYYKDSWTCVWPWSNACTSAERAVQNYPWEAVSKWLMYKTKNLPTWTGQNSSDYKRNIMEYIYWINTITCHMTSYDVLVILTFQSSDDHDRFKDTATPNHILAN